MSALKLKICRLRKSGKPTEAPSLLVMTIGHSTRTLEEFISLLKAQASVSSHYLNC